MEDDLKIVYVAGVGRSGSTLLDLILGDNEIAISTGEIANIFSALQSNNEYCSCGELASKCNFWVKVLREYERVEEFTSIHEYLRLQKKYERIRNIPFLIISKYLRTQEYQNYTNSQVALYRAIAKVSNKNVIIDSSKKPVRALSLSCSKNLNFYVLHLIRDGRGVAWSMKKSFKKDSEKGIQKDLVSTPIWKTAILWSVINVLISSWHKFGLLPHYHLIRYEEIIESVDSELNRIGNFLNTDFSSTLKKIADGVLIVVGGHSIAGNRVRMKKNIRLKPDYEWKEALSAGELNSFWAIAGAVAKIYGFKKHSK